jgi:hypothetical protein
MPRNSPSKIERVSEPHRGLGASSSATRLRARQGVVAAANAEATWCSEGFVIAQRDARFSDRSTAA